MATSKTELANRALSLVGRDPAFLDVDTDTTPVGRLVALHYEPVFLRCLRKSEWPFAIKRLALSPDATAPTNEFSTRFALPATMMRLLQVFPEGIKYRIEEGHLCCDESVITIKYVDKACLADPSVIDPAFAEWFTYELALALSPSLTDSTTLQGNLNKLSEARFREAAGLFSQEDGPDTIPESIWVTSRASYDSGESIVYEGF